MPLQFRYLLCCLLLGLTVALPNCPGQDDVAQASEVHLVPVRLPLTGDGDKEIQRAVIKLMEQLGDTEDRPVVIFEFTGRQGRALVGTEFERALSLARFLSGGELKKIRTVAYLPESVRGHAVLIVLACEQLVMGADAELGEAGIIETVIDDSLRAAYRDIASRRRILPLPLVMGMLDPVLAVYRVETPAGTEWVHDAELQKLTEAGEVIRVDTVTPPGKLGIHTGNELAGDDRLVSHLAENRQQLAEALRLAPGSIREQSAMGARHRGIQIEIRGQLSRNKIDTVRRTLGAAIAKGSVQLISVVIDSPGGDIAASVDLAGDLLAIDNPDILTVAVIRNEARADAAVIALACDDLVMLEGSVLGGPGAAVATGQPLKDLELVVREIADQKGRDWSLSLALVSQEITIHQYENVATGDRRFWSKQQLSEQDQGVQWKRGRLVETVDGLTPAAATGVYLVHHVIQNVDEVNRLYRLDEPLKTAERPWLTDTIERLAAEPWFGRLMLFIAFLALMSEASAPGLGIPGFISATTFLLFFWIQFLNGTAGWLEVALFVGGLAFVAMEIFVLPGLGIFGIGGGLMILISIVLASQTFVLPRNGYQLAQTANSLLSIGLVGVGLVATGIVMRRYLPQTRMFQRFAVPPPSGEERESIEWNESVVHLDHLVGKEGITATPLSPSGKVRFDEKLVDVVSDGEIIAVDMEVIVELVAGNRVVVRRKLEPE